VPFCEDCAKYWAPSAMRSDGSCPTCGRVLEEPRIASTVPTGRRVTADNLDLKALARGDDADAKAPWHFKLLVVALVLYLGWRVVDLFL
jgi:hypothetical protein